MKNALNIFIFCIFIVFLLCFSPAELYPGWFRHYGGSNDESIASSQQTSDGGYIISGSTKSYTYGDGDFAIYKLNSNGNKIWFKHYGGTSYEIGLSVQQTSDGGYVVAGHTSSYSYGLADFAIYKLNSNGNKTWFKHYGGTQWDRGYSIQQTSEGGYIIAGETNSYTHGNLDFSIYKLDSSGNKVWFKHYGGSDYERARSIQQTSDGGYVVAGGVQSYSNGGYDFGIYKIDSGGIKVWFKHYGGINDDFAKSIQQTSDGGYVLTGYTHSYSYGGTDFAIYKLDSNGNKVWFKHYGGEKDDYGESIQQTSDSGYIVAGYTYTYTNGASDFALYKLDSSGNKVWFKHYGGSNEDMGNSTQQTIDGGYILCGGTMSYTYGGSDMAIYKLGSDGDK